jgi:hypothetical protein
MESYVWAGAVVLGLMSGAWNANTSPPANELTQPMRLSSVTAPVDANQDPVVNGPESARSVVMQIGGWIMQKAIAFVRVAWWLLPIPIVFSLWRQFRTVPICAHCDSANLVAVT